jgi:tetraacyldisaccharide 4'-kinase
LSLLFQMLVSVRRIAYRFGWLRSERLPVPVVIVGNITVGGSGKTPLVIHLARSLRERRRSPGVIARGFGGNVTTPLEVDPHGDPAHFGDEALVLARSCGCPVFVGRDRAATGRALLELHPACDVILTDDGLQHYRLKRDLELALFDARGVMNGWLLPAGPLREPVGRLAGVDAVILHEYAVLPAPTIRGPVFSMRLEGGVFTRLDEPNGFCKAEDLKGLRLHAVAGIGSPGRFFDQLRRMSLEFTEHPFPDHHAYVAADVCFGGDAILTTEKDAVKLARLPLAIPVWVLPVSASLTPDLVSFVLEKLNGCTPA